MTPSFNKVHNRFKLNSRAYTHQELKEVAYSFIKEGEPFEKSLGNFLADWLDSKTYITTKTSGTTGTPKSIKIEKQAMVNSAIATGDFFGLTPGDTALHCLPTQFIAGKMMLVRAIILGLEIDVIAPKTVLSFNEKKAYHFSAIIPMQLQRNLTKFSNIKQVIVGGAPIASQLIAQIQDLKTTFFATYGMTETITHIAVKQLNNLPLQDDNKQELTISQIHALSHFKTLPNIKISQDERDCLVIEAPKLTKEKLVTNDVVKLHSKTSFDWLGRIDNVINSGGLKFFPEQIEDKLKNKIPNRFFITSETDSELGEKVILVIEGKSNKLPAQIFEDLDTYQIPKKIYAVPKFIETTSGKIQRLQTLELLA